ncbi:MAG: class I SAM-dependent methyltransferase [Pseudobdellovibrionaceae bacterium]|nr:MAG: class I SAM-dependent methyltransferase [Pseudobdellovibrionaceae bacterium]
MADKIFEDQRLVNIYDCFDGQRDDLQHYLAIANELNANSILDIGCGTGCFASLLGKNGFEVIGLEPAEASLNMAKTKPYTENVKWILGDTTDLPSIKVDLAVMTGNVAQVFLEDKSWEQTLKSIHKALYTNGHLVFEVRDPSKKAWLDWTKDKTEKKLEVPNIGVVNSWCEVTSVSDEFVSFRWNYFFEADGEAITSDSTLRFREKEDIIQSLEKSGYAIKEIRDAPDRPGKEFVFIAETKS